MSSADQSLIHTLIAEEIRRLVAESIENGSCLPAGQSAAALSRAYPNCGLAPDYIAEQIIEAAVRARVAVELSRPEARRVA